jgi:hypothetical protein
MPTRRSLLVWSVLVAMALVALAGSLLAYRHFYPPTRFDPERLAAYYAALQPLPAKPVDAATVTAAAQAAAGYLRRVNDPGTGEFTYIVNIDPTIPVVRNYSILRHQGTVFALGMFDDAFPDPENVAVMRRAVEYMRRCCYQDVENGKVTAIGEPGFVANQGSRNYYKLGGAGLGLLALASVERKSPGFVPPDEMQKVAALGRLLQKRDGSFYSLYNPAAGGPTAYNKSLYYPGEMAKGWVALYELQPTSVDALRDASRALEYLAVSRARLGSAPADHWALLATARLLAASASSGIEVPREALVNHALQVCHAMLDEARHPQPLPVMEGSLAPKGAVTATATRLEGLQAALTFLPADHPIVPHIRAAIDRGIDFLVRAQVKEGPYAGGLPQAISRLPDDGSPGVRAFNAQATEIRIDYVQHSLSALVQYLQRAH